MNAYVSCNVLCNLNCKTCNGAGSNQCTDCDQGYYLSGGSCLQGQLLRSHYYPSGSGSGYYWISPNAWSTCGSHYVLFGYRQFQTGKYVGYQSDPIYSRNYYGFSVKMRVLFIDKWPSTGAIKIHRDNINNQP